MNHIKSLFTAILPALFIAGVVAASTTISQNIVTEGDLTVGGNASIGTDQSNTTLTVNPDTGTATIEVGQDHLHVGVVNVYGNAGSGDPFIRLFNPADDDGVADYWQLKPEAGNLQIGPDIDSDAFSIDTSGNVSATGSYSGDGSQLSGVQKSIGDNLVSYWKFEDNLLDTGLTQDLSLTAGTETYVDSPFGRAVDFDGSTYYQANDTDYDFDITDAFSIEMWIKTPASATDVYLAKGIADERYQISSGASRSQLDWFLFDTSGKTFSVRTSATVRDDTWHHFVATYDGSNSINGMKTYVDTVEGHSINQDTGPLGSILNNENLAIGADSNGGNIADGQLSHVRVYNTELTAEQVETLFHTR